MIKTVNKMIIRQEQKEDINIVENLIRDAFWNVHEPGATEHYLAHQMRTHKDFVHELNMVAEIDGKIVGSIMYTIGKLISEEGITKKCIRKRKNYLAKRSFIYTLIRVCMCNY